MEGKRLLHKLRLTNFLSYGPEGTEIELQPLNVLIGPNGSGKSNLIEAISLLKAAPSDISAPMRAGGGIPAWTWKGWQAKSHFVIDTLVEYENTPRMLQHMMEVNCTGVDWLLSSELIDEFGKKYPNNSQRPYYKFRSTQSKLPDEAYESEDSSLCILYGKPFPHPPKDNSVRSILTRLRDPDRYPEITYLGQVYPEICIFCDWNLGPNSPFHGPQRADGPASFLLSDGSNFGIVLNDLLNQLSTKKSILNQLNRFYTGIEDITSKIYANTVETYFHEKGFSESTPAIRLSDGTIRYLCLLMILCHPEPPPLVCIEEPELGLHPDALPIIAELLIGASQRMQLIVTTHSDILISALTEVPEAVVVCEKDKDGSHLQRLDPDRLKSWLKKYSLGELWITGEIGGTT
jgi:predicted ATPase